VRFIANFLKDETGATAAEYALLIAFIAVVIIGGATVLGTNISGSLSKTAGTI
jgi:pilus assembly protein Flp/PilA